ncbi:MAG: porin [Hyphomicrobiaceae bacterium]|nr:porin [Hyphomicrobiaceae bacterium]
MTPFLRLRLCAPVFLACLCATTPLYAADLGGDCCADLEERIAELEATTARKGNRKVSLSVSGHVNHAVLFWDDGHERNAYVVGNKNDQSNFSFTGDAEIAKGVRAGYAVTIRLKDNLSDEVSQDSDDGEAGFVLWESYWFLESEKLGKLSVGQVSRVSDTAPENDLSESGLPGYAGVQDMGGGFALRFRSGALSGLTLGDVYNHFNGDTANIIRYDTPSIAGFVLSASYGEDDIWDVGARYEGDFNSIKIAASIAYTHASDENGLDGSGDASHETLVGSVAVLHEPSGLNALVAAGNRSYDDPVTDLDGIDRTPRDSHFIYAKLGWIAKLTNVGPTAFYGEYGRFSDFISATGDFTLADAGGAAPAVRIAGNTAQVWGFGVVQHIEPAEMQIYIGYRHHDFDFDLVDAAGNATTGESLESFRSVVIGSKISF